MFEDTTPRVLFYEDEFKEKVQKVNPESLGVDYSFGVTHGEDEYASILENNPDTEPMALALFFLLQVMNPDISEVWESQMVAGG